MTSAIVANLIPTKNRSEFLIRQLRYYASVESPHPVYIGVASDKDHRRKNEEEIENLSDRVSINYYHWPEKNDRETIASLGESVKENYCAFAGDDDFLIPDSLTQCAEFLGQNLEYRTAQGRAILFSLAESSAYGTFSRVGAYWRKKGMEAESGHERILEFGRNYWVPQFSVHRTNEFVDDSIQYKDISDKSFGELLHSFTFICKGKSRFVDCLYMVRQDHDTRYTLPDAFNWITRVDWNPSYQTFRNSLVFALMETDDISEEKAQGSVNQAFRAYLSLRFSRKFQLRDILPEEIESVETRAKSIPKVKEIRRAVRNWMYRHTKLEYLVGHRRRLGACHRGGPARQYHGLRIKGREQIWICGTGLDLAIDATFTHPTRDKLSYLRTEVNDQDSIAHARPIDPSWSCHPKAIND